MAMITNLLFFDVATSELYVNESAVFLKETSMDLPTTTRLEAFSDGVFAIITTIFSTTPGIST